MKRMERDAIRGYLDDEGRVIQWPGRKHRAEQMLILQYLASKFEAGKLYTEREVTDLLRQHHTFEDWAMLRREMFEMGFINRTPDGSEYWVTPSVKFF